MVIMPCPKCGACGNLGCACGGLCRCGVPHNEMDRYCECDMCVEDKWAGIEYLEDDQLGED
jgi:hypothetical protein